MSLKRATSDTSGSRLATLGNVRASHFNLHVPDLMLPVAVALMQSYARQHGLAEFISIQNFHAPVYREEEREMTPLIKELGLGMIPWSPMGAGLTARPFSKEPVAKTKREETSLYV